MLMSTSKVDSIRTTLKKYVHSDITVKKDTEGYVVKIESLDFKITVHEGEPVLATVRNSLHEHLESISDARSRQEEDK